MTDLFAAGWGCMDRAAIAFSWIDAIERTTAPTAELREMARAARGTAVAAA
jgi:hypothetical protein